MAKRRGHNEGSIFQRKDGRWCAVISLGYKDGKLSRKNYYGATRKEVSDKMDEGRTSLKKGIAPVIGRQTLAQFLETWLKNHIKPRRKPATFASYDQQVRLHIGPSLGHMDITKLIPDHVEQYINDKMAEGLSGRTVRYHRLILTMALKQAERKGFISRNVAKLTDPPQMKEHEVECLTPEQADTLLDALEGERFELLFRIMLTLGLRKGEALGLRWQDIDFEAKTISLRYQITSQRVNKALVLTELKTKKSRRVLPLPETLASFLKEHRRQQLERRMAAGDRWIDMGLVFTVGLGGPINPGVPNRHLDRILTAAGLPHQRVHDLRHNCASFLLAQGVELKVISDILGHAQISTTANIYAHVFASVKQDAITALDRMFTAQG
ncbi:MAG TPA: site-specific integrase [Blastocatellia bacterium]|nr:site-specific integrase [Blastocatellia bacterium]